MPFPVVSRRSSLRLSQVSSMTLAFMNLALITLAFLVLMPPLASAKDGRDFAGYYAVSHVAEAPDDAGKTDQAAKVDLTLSLQIFNHSDLGDIKSPVLGLLESGPSHALLGEFGAVKVLPANRDVIVSGNFSIPKEVFTSWSRRGISPKVVVIYRDASGRVLRQNIQLSRRPALPPPTGE